MSDDIVITEQTEVDESKAFESDSKDILEDDGLKQEIKEDITEKKTDKKEEVKEDEKKEEKEKSEDDSEEEESEEEDKEESEEEESEDDEDVKRGKEIIEKETKAQAEREAAEKAEKEKRIETPTPPTERKLDAKTVEWYKSVIPQNFLPENVTLSDGSVLDFASMPEVPIAAAAIAHNIVSQMIHNGYLMTSSDFNNLAKEMDNKFFMASLTNSYDGIPNVQEIASSDKFKKWLPEQPKEIQALQRSTDYKDHVKLFKRYLNDAGIKEANDKTKKIDDERKSKKKKFDDIHKTTVKSKGKANSSNISPREEEIEGFTSKDNDDDFYIR